MEKISWTIRITEKRREKRRSKHHSHYKVEKRANQHGKSVTTSFQPHLS